jgi:sugar phosphate permease
MYFAGGRHSIAIGAPQVGEDGKTGEVRPAVATTVRYEVLTLVPLMAVLLYLDRFCVGIAADEITKEMHLSDLQMGLVFASFFLAYGLAQVPTSALGDRVGARLMLGGCVLGWSVLTALFGVVETLEALIVVRLLLGICQAAAYPVAARVLSLWVPYSRRALGNGLVTMGGRAGGALAPWLTGYLIILFGMQWRPAFWLYGGVGVLWAIYFVVRFRNSPQEQPRCNAAEIELIVGSRPAEASDPRGTGTKVPWRIALQSTGLWLQCAGQFAGNIAWVFLGTWLPTYLQRTYAIDLSLNKVLASLPLAGGMFGCLLGGIAADRLTRRLGLRWSRNVLGISSKLLAAGFMVVSVQMHDVWLATAALVLASFTNDLGLSATWAYFQDAGGPYVGPLVGFANMFGNIGATASPVILQQVAFYFGWEAALYACAALFLVAGVCWFGMDGRVPIVPEGSVKNV